MEALESGGPMADPLLSAALSSPNTSREEHFLQDYQHHGGGRSSPHAGTIFG